MTVGALAFELRIRGVTALSHIRKPSTRGRIVGDRPQSAQPRPSDKCPPDDRRFAHTDERRSRGRFACVRPDPKNARAVYTAASRLAEDVSAYADTLGLCPQIIRIAEEIGIHHGRRRWVSISQLDRTSRARAECIGVHRNSGARGDFRDARFDADAKEEVELQVGSRSVFVGIPKGAAFDDIRRDRPLPNREYSSPAQIIQ
jgi:hypothetical protein